MAAGVTTIPNPNQCIGPNGTNPPGSNWCGTNATTLVTAIAVTTDGGVTWHIRPLPWDIPQPSVDNPELRQCRGVLAGRSRGGATSHRQCARRRLSLSSWAQSTEDRPGRESPSPFQLELPTTTASRTSPSDGSAVRPQVHAWLSAPRHKTKTTAIYSYEAAPDRAARHNSVSSDKRRKPQGSSLSGTTPGVLSGRRRI